MQRVAETPSRGFPVMTKDRLEDGCIRSYPDEDQLGSSWTDAKAFTLSGVLTEALSPFRSFHPFIHGNGSPAGDGRKSVSKVRSAIANKSGRNSAAAHVWRDSKAGGKRKLDTGAGKDDGDEDEDSDTDDGPPRRIFPKVVRDKRRFACPYFKHDPQKYKYFRSCPGPGWDRIHRVKYVLVHAFFINP
jgi:hypothetical protein